MIYKINAESSCFREVNTKVSDVEMDGMKAVRVIKNDKIEQYDENTYAELKDLRLRNGTIIMKMKSRLLPDAPSYARGFIGIVFRAEDDSSEFESFYIRPTNGRNCTDPVRRKHGCQYFSYPGYTFQYFREFSIDRYEAPVDLALDEWFTLKAIIQDSHAGFYLNEDDTPVLEVNDLKHGEGIQGKIGIYVDIGTEAFVSSINIETE